MPRASILDARSSLISTLVTIYFQQLFTTTFNSTFLYLCTSYTVHFDQKTTVLIVIDERENDRRIPHRYRRGDKILLLNKQANKYERPYLGPYKVLEFLPESGNVRIQKGPVSERVNIRRVTPFRE